ncbi:hypothetical protein C8R44DRAFT_91206 [Mycena epipterygia]|nr:hypothetical protein C8R44DRAFT_91206 [Mycena epipterygia]
MDSCRVLPRRSMLARAILELSMVGLLLSRLELYTRSTTLQLHCHVYSCHVGNALPIAGKVCATSLDIFNQVSPSIPTLQTTAAKASAIILESACDSSIVRFLGLELYSSSKSTHDPECADDSLILESYFLDLIH